MTPPGCLRVCTFQVLVVSPGGGGQAREVVQELHQRRVGVAVVQRAGHHGALEDGVQGVSFHQGGGVSLEIPEV